MKTYKITLVAVVCSFWLILTSSLARALNLDFAPAVSVVNPGDSVDVGIRISGLGNLTAPSLSLFDFDVNFNPAVLSFNSATFGAPSLGDQLDLGAGSLTGFVSGPGSVNLVEISLAAPNTLESNQLASFILATLTFDAIGGISNLGLSLNALGDANGDTLLGTAVTIGAGSVSAVPEPGSLLLFGPALIGLARVWKKARPR